MIDGYNAHYPVPVIDAPADLDELLPAGYFDQAAPFAEISSLDLCDLEERLEAGLASWDGTALRVATNALDAIDREIAGRLAKRAASND